MLGDHGLSNGGVAMATLMGREFPSHGFTKEREKEDSYALCQLSISVQTQAMQMECFLIKLYFYCLSIIMMN